MGNDLLTKCEPLFERALRMYDLGDATLFAAFRRNPLGAAIYAEHADEEEPELVLTVKGAEFPKGLEAAIAKFSDAYLAELEAPTRDMVAQSLRGRGRLALLVTPWPATIELVLYPGNDDEPIVLRPIGAREPAH
jgi:hypothetical protein